MEPWYVCHSMSTCPAETTLSDLLAGGLPPEQRSEVLSHLEGCVDCQRVLAAAAEDSQGGADARPTSAPLERGATLARYVVLERIGAGAMGVVYAAYDPQLDRQVALKVLRPEGRQVEELRQRLVLEAQSLARLSHANVVTVHDVGTHDDCVFLAMELVDGVTLAEWLRAPRTWQEVLGVFSEAGRGLMAAHAAGLVHRDFKPANVLVGRDGRARVTDFGMARPLNRGESPASRVTDGTAASTASPTITPLTRTGALLGTPAYMAPELLRGRRADALSDQFSFCVALHEALYGVRPFEGDSLEAVARAALEGRVRPVAPGAKVPAWVRQAVLRGLRPRPEERYPSMEPLLAALTPPPRRVRGRVAALAGVACLLGAAVAYTAAHRSEARCARETEKLVGAWSPAQRERVRAAFLATGAPYAAVAWEKASAALDAHAAQWHTLRTEACIASHEAPTGNAWQTAACLDARLWQLASTTQVLERADAQTVRNAQQLVASLEGLDGCRDAPGSAARPQPPDALRARVDAARRTLADAEAQRGAGRYTEGLRLTTVLVEELEGLDYKPLEAEVLLAHGNLLALAGKPKEAEDILYKALWAAEAGRDDETVARTWNLLIWVVGSLLSRVPDAERIVRHAEAVVERLGRERFPAIAAELHLRRTALLLSQGKYPEADSESSRGLELARKAHEPDSLRTAEFIFAHGRALFRLRKHREAVARLSQALELRERHLGREHPELIPILNTLSAAFLYSGQAEEAIRTVRRAIAIHEASGGPENSNLAAPLSTLALQLRTQGQVAEARKHQARALAIMERTFGPDHPQTGLALANLGQFSSDLDRIDEALDLYQRALRAFERAQGQDSLRSLTVLFYRSETYLRVGRDAEARRDLLRAWELVEKAHGPDSAMASACHLRMGELQLRMGAPAEALATCQRALELDTRIQGPESMDAARNEACIAEAHLLLGAPERALPLAERARERLASATSERTDAAKATFLLARVVRALKPAERARAAALGEEARARFESLGSRARPELERVVAWQRREGLK
jgi:tetratricopeptide (TPR) repeat protein